MQTSCFLSDAIHTNGQQLERSSIMPVNFLITQDMYMLDMFHDQQVIVTIWSIVVE
jgi:hypothetical protein